MRELFESTIERLLSDIATPEYVRAAEQNVWPADLWRALEENGITLAGAPEEVGGSEASWADLFVIVRAAGQHAAPVPLVEMLLGNWLLEQCGIGSRSGILTVATDSTLTCSAGALSGELRYVPWGRNAELVVTVVTSDEGYDVVLLELAAAERIVEGVNVAGEPRDILHFSAALPLASVPLPAGLSPSVLLAGGAMLRSAQIAGALTAIMTLTSAYAGERKQFGRPISAFQAIQQQLAVLAEQAAAANIAAEAAFAQSDTALATFSIAAAKVSASDAASQATSIGHSVHGAIGFTQEYSLHLLTRRLWAWRSEFGSSTYWSKLLGEAVCNAGAEGFWPLITQSHNEQRPISE